MEANEYQKLTARVILFPEITRQDLIFTWNSISPEGNIGIIAEKDNSHWNSIDFSVIKNDLGDALLYIAALCTRFGFDMSEVMENNVEKFKIIYPDRINSENGEHHASAGEKYIPQIVSAPGWHALYNDGTTKSLVCWKSVGDDFVGVVFRGDTFICANQDQDFVRYIYLGQA